MPMAFRIGIDQDPEALKAAAKRLSGFECSVKLVSSNFSDITDVVDHVGVEHVDRNPHGYRGEFVSA